MVVLDTNIIIDHLRTYNSENDSYFLRIAQKLSKDALAISLITIQELYRGKSTTISSEEETMISFLSMLKILPYTSEIAKLAGQIDRDSNRSVEFADAAIAATAIVNGYDLYTLNMKDFKDIPHLQFYR